jgi:hypothetical protein
MRVFITVLLFRPFSCSPCRWSHQSSVTLCHTWGATPVSYTIHSAYSGRTVGWNSHTDCALPGVPTCRHTSSTGRSVAHTSQSLPNHCHWPHRTYCLTKWSVNAAIPKQQVVPTSCYVIPLTLSPASSLLSPASVPAPPFPRPPRPRPLPLPRPLPRPLPAAAPPSPPSSSFTLPSPSAPPAAAEAPPSPPLSLSPAAASAFAALRAAKK